MSSASDWDVMTDDEIADYIADSLQVLMVMSDTGSPKLAEVEASFRGDLEILRAAGRLDKDSYDALINLEDYRL